MKCQTCYKNEATKTLMVAKGTKNQIVFQLCVKCHAFHKWLLQTSLYETLEWY